MPPFGRLGRLFRRPWRGEADLAAELDEELSFHLEMRTEELVAEGVAPREARERAERELGGLGRTRSALLASDRRIERRRRLGDGVRELAGDLRLAARGLAKSPGFTLAVVLSLALGIGANTAVFSLIDALLLKSLPVAEPGRLVALGDTSRVYSLSQGSLRSDLASVPMYERLRDQNRVFTGLFASGRTGRLRLGETSSGAGEWVRGRLVSGNYFAVLGVSAFLGRTFTGADERGGPGSAPYVVLSHEYWQRHFGSDPGIVGKALVLNGYPLTVVGVGPPGFFGEIVGRPSDLWIPLVMQPSVEPGRDHLARWDTSWLLLMGRLRPGVTFEAARTSIEGLFHRIVASRADGAIPAELLGDDPQSLELEVSPGAAGFSYWRRRFSRPLATLMAIVALVLLIACANVATLLLERATGRRRELGVRLALGAGRGRLVRQLLAEGLLLAGLGGAVGALVAVWTGAGLLSLIGLPSSSGLGVDLDLRVLGFTAAAALGTGLLFSLGPALRATRVELAPALEAGTRGSVGEASGGGASARAWPLGKILVVAQLALSLLLVTGAGLFLRTLVNLGHLDLGFRRQGLVMLEIDPITAGYQGERLDALLGELHERLGALPGVAGVALSENGLFSGTESSTSIALAGRPPLPPADAEARYDRVGPSYFDVVGIPIVRGRALGPQDRAGAPPAAVVNEAMARAFFPGEDPLGRRFSDTDEADVVYEIVGVSRDVRDHDVRGAVPPRFYTPYLQSDSPISAFNFELRTATPEALVEPIRKTLQEVDPGIVVETVGSLEENVAGNLSDERLIARLSTVFGALALLLAAVGLYGVISYATARRTGEIGVRMALGADGRQILWMVLRETLLLALAGAALGLPAVLACSRLVASRLYGLSAHDLPTILAAAAILVVVALAAGALPAARATRIHPTEALRSE